MVSQKSLMLSCITILQAFMYAHVTVNCMKREALYPVRNWWVFMPILRRLRKTGWNQIFSWSTFFLGVAKRRAGKWRQGEKKKSVVPMFPLTAACNSMQITRFSALVYPSVQLDATNQLISK
jgi:hypothetical protein